MSFQVNIESSGDSFPVDPGQSILTAALQHGIKLPYGCRNGTCTSCIASLISGQVHYPDGKPEALKDSTMDRPVALCKACAHSDLLIAIRELPPSPDIQVKILPCRVEQLQRLSHDVMQVMLKLPATERLSFLAGQYIEFILKDGRRRAFSIANAPHQDERLELHIRHVPGGSFTGHVFADMQNRAMLRIEGPLGSFYLREESPRPIIMMAGGTGFAPLKSILEHAFHIGFERPIHLFWGVQAQRDLYMNDLPRSWAQQHPLFDYTPVLFNPAAGEPPWEGATGPVGDAVLQTCLDLSDFDIYMSGPPAMIEAATPQLVEHGAQPENLYSDAFEFARDILKQNG